MPHVGGSMKMIRMIERLKRKYEEKMPGFTIFTVSSGAKSD